MGDATNIREVAQCGDGTAAPDSDKAPSSSLRGTLPRLHTRAANDSRPWPFGSGSDVLSIIPGVTPKLTVEMRPSERGQYPGWKRRRSCVAGAAQRPQWAQVERSELTDPPSQRSQARAGSTRPQPSCKLATCAALKTPAEQFVIVREWPRRSEVTGLVLPAATVRLSPGETVSVVVGHTGASRRNCKPETVWGYPFVPRHSERR